MCREIHSINKRQDLLSVISIRECLFFFSEKKSPKKGNLR
ncbi:hypothetical protein CHCC20335_2060 [Bacillus paralicheniformis]|nr:hypothetical protein CHCC20335_2060 [Bacillus paralicheniformis]